MFAMDNLGIDAQMNQYVGMTAEDIAASDAPAELKAIAAMQEPGAILKRIRYTDDGSIDSLEWASR